jgi:hypothetical protein
MHARTVPEKHFHVNHAWAHLAHETSAVELAVDVIEAENFL